MKRKLILAVAASLSLSPAFAQSTNPAPYCNASFDDPFGVVEDQINSVSFGQLSNTTNAQYAAPHYVFYNNLPQKEFRLGQSYPLTVTFDVHGGCGYGVWIDFNHNNTFEASEKVAGTTGTNIMDLGTDIQITKTVTIPATATPGVTRMRVRIVEDDGFTMNSTDILPCNASTSATDVMDWGETEDYEIKLVSNSSTGVADASLGNVVAIFPNPSNGRVHLQSPVGMSRVEVYNLMDANVYAQNLGEVTECSIEPALPTGLYMLRINTRAGVVVHKLQIIQ